MIRYSADFWNFDLWSRFEFRNEFWPERILKSLWFDIRPIFEILICDRDLNSKIHSDINASQNHDDSKFGRFFKFRSAIEIWSQKCILISVQIKIIMIRHSADFLNFDLRSKFEFRMDFDIKTSQNHHDSIFGRFLIFWSTIEIWVQIWILS